MPKTILHSLQGFGRHHFWILLQIFSDRGLPINQIGFIKEAVVAKPTNIIAGPASAVIVIANPTGQDAVPEIQAPPAGQQQPDSEGNHGKGY